MISKYYSPIKETKNPWRIGWFQGQEEKIQDETGAFCNARKQGGTQETKGWEHVKGMQGSPQNTPSSQSWHSLNNRIN